MTGRRGGRPGSLMAGADVMLVGLSSAKDKEVDAKLDLLAASVETLGGRVVGRHVQRRGVSRGGARRMASPFSRRNVAANVGWDLIRPGKLG